MAHFVRRMRDLRAERLISERLFARCLLKPGFELELDPIPARVSASLVEVLRREQFCELE